MWEEIAFCKFISQAERLVLAELSFCWHGIKWHRAGEKLNTCRCGSEVGPLSRSEPAMGLTVVRQKITDSTLDAISFATVAELLNLSTSWSNTI